MNILEIIGRKKSLFDKDIEAWEDTMSSEIRNSSFLVLGAAGSIGQSVTKQIFKRNPKVLYGVDILENNLVELVRVI